MLYVTLETPITHREVRSPVIKRSSLRGAACGHSASSTPTLLEHDNVGAIMETVHGTVIVVADRGRFALDNCLLMCTQASFRSPGPFHTVLAISHGV